MAKDFFTVNDKKRIEDTIAEAELKTRGEIQVHIESTCKLPVLERAAQVFSLLGMHKTELRSGVLFYLAVMDKKFAVIGDAGINERVPEGFWVDITDHMANLFKESRFTDGLVDGIQMAGQQLSKHFPPTDNFNELSNEISFGEN